MLDMGFSEDVLTLAEPRTDAREIPFLKSTAKKELDQIASRIKREFSGASIRVEGYTDSSQPNKMKARFPTNEALSEARAESVRAYLASKGVNNPMSAVGYGSAKPKSTKAASRRVEIHVGN